MRICKPFLHLGNALFGKMPYELQGLTSNIHLELGLVMTGGYYCSECVDLASKFSL